MERGNMGYVGICDKESARVIMNASIKKGLMIVCEPLHGDNEGMYLVLVHE